MNHPCTRREFCAALGGLVTAASVGLTKASDSRSGVWSVAIVGHTGRGNYGHGLDTMWANLPETRVVGVADPDAEGLDRALKRIGCKQGFADYRDMLEQTRPDIAAIGMRHIDQHRDVALAAIEAGVRGIYMEKPFCRTPAEADEIVAACQERNVKLALAHRNRYHPVLPVIAQRIEEGEIGRLLEIRARGKEDRRGGMLDLWVLGSHLLNIIPHYGGNPLACTATVVQDGTPARLTDLRDGAEGIGPICGNGVHARFELESGVPAFFDSMQNAGLPEAGFGLQLVGTEGVIDLRMDEEPLAHLMPGSPFPSSKTARTWVPVSSAGPGKPEPIPDLKKQVMGHLLGARDLFDAIRNDRQPLCNEEEGRITVEMIAAVCESHRRNGERAGIPLPNRSHPWKTGRPS